MKQDPLVSIIINCYNGEKYLERALKSVINQKYKNFELIFWDNLSNDGSKKVFEKFSDQRFKYFKSENHKILYDARNDALKQCNGKYIAFLDTDDYWLENRLSSQVSIMEDNSSIGLVYGNYIKYNKNRFFFKKKKIKSNNFKSGKITEHLVNNYQIGLLTVLIRKNFMTNDLKFFNSQYNLLSDFDYILKFSKKYNLHFVDDYIAVYYQHDDQLQSKNLSEQARQLESWFKNNLEKGFLFEKNYNLRNIEKKIKFLNLASKIKEKNFLFSLKDLLLYPNNLDKIKLILLLLLPEKLYKKIFSFT